MWMVFHVAKLDGIDLCFFPVMIWLITLLGSTCIMIWIRNSTTIDAYWEWNQVFQCKIEIRNVSCFVVKKRLNMKFLFPCDCLKVPLKSIKIVQRKCILLFTVQNVVRSRTMHVLNKRCVNLEGKKNKYQTYSI